jgi:hypothetical protein
VVGDWSGTPTLTRSASQWPEQEGAAHHPPVVLGPQHEGPVIGKAPDLVSEAPIGVADGRDGLRADDVERFGQLGFADGVVPVGDQQDGPSGLHGPDSVEPVEQVVFGAGRARHRCGPCRRARANITCAVTAVQPMPE